MWLWVAVGAGILLRAFFVFFTEGTVDVEIWKSHAQGILDNGLIGQYQSSEYLNHPPLACWVASGILRLSQLTGAPFAALFRAPIALVDVGCAFLLGHIFRRTIYRWVVIGLYATHPLAIILSAYHGNTDSLIAFVLLLCVVGISEDQPVLAGVALGVSFWIKLPGLLVAPALTFAFKHWKGRFIFGAMALLVGVLTYIPVLIPDPGIVYTRVFGYQGFPVFTSGGIRIWGWLNFLQFLPIIPVNWQSALFGWANDHNRLIVLVPLIAFAWMRRGMQSAVAVGTTVAASFAIVYGFTNNWSFQYFAWSIPFWFMVGPTFLMSATLLAGGYIYAVYAFECDNAFLLGTWDFNGHPLWPIFLRRLRDVTVAFFFVTSIVFLWRAIRSEWHRFHASLTISLIRKGAVRRDRKRRGFS